VKRLLVIKRKVYLPSGYSWENLWNHEEVKGGDNVEVEAPIEQIPLFMREVPISAKAKDFRNIFSNI